MAADPVVLGSFVVGPLLSFGLYGSAAPPQNYFAATTNVEKLYRENGRVVVSTQHSPEQGIFRVIVEDNGGGIEPEDLERIFLPFSSNKGSRGTGLGLPVSQKILKEHGGQIRVSSTPNVGSKFTLEFPANVSDSAVRKTIAEPPST